MHTKIEVMKYTQKKKMYSKFDYTKNVLIFFNIVISVKANK